MSRRSLSTRAPRGPLPGMGEPDRPRVRRLLGLLALALALSIAYVWEQIETDKLALQRQTLQEQRDRLVHLTEITQAEIARLSRYSAIEAVATTRLQMEYPDGTPQVLIIPPTDAGAGWRTWLEPVRRWWAGGGNE